MKTKDRVNEIYNDLLNVRNNILDCKPAKSLSCNYCDVKATIKKIVENNHDSIFTPAFNYYLIYNSFRRGDTEFRVELNRSLYHLINYYSMMVELGNFFDVTTQRRSTTLKYCYDKNGNFIDFNNLCNQDELKQSILLYDAKQRSFYSAAALTENKYHFLLEIMKTLAGIMFFNNQIDRYEDNVKVYEENLDQKYDDLFLQGICRIVTYRSGSKRVDYSPDKLARYIESKMDEKIKEIK
jgi:hypothetical protein